MHMKKMLFFITVLSGTTPSYAQQDSIPLGIVAYYQQANLPGDEHKNGHATLLFNRTNSLYIQNAAPKRDSSFSISDSPISVSGDKEGFPIYKYHQKHQLFSKIPCRQSPKKHCVVRDTFGDIEWMLYPEHKRFGTYDCRRAMGKFRGREYEAWYAPEIPVPSGPFKLGGLPGLILEATSLDGKVKFMFEGLEISPNISATIRFPSGKNLDVDQAGFEREQEVFLESLLREYKARGAEVSISRQETIEIWNEY